MDHPSDSARALLNALVEHIETTSVVADDPRTFLSYKDLHEILGLQLRGPTYGESLKKQGLNELAEWTKTNVLPTISGMIIDRNSLQPGQGYFEYFRGGVEDWPWWYDEIRKSIGFNWRPYLGAEPEETVLPPATQLAVDLEVPADRQLCQTYRILRDTALALKVKNFHRYQCQVCGHTIELPDGSRYAEAHHIRPLGTPHDGPDVIGNILCLCPNHHAEVDYGVVSLTLAGLRTTPLHTVDPKFVEYHNQTIVKRRQT